MGRMFIILSIAFLAINLSSGVVIQSGFAEAVGIEHTMAGDEQVDEAQEEAQDINTGTESQNTLFGMYNAVTSTLGTISSVVTAGPAMLNQLGLPSILTNMIAVLVTVVYGMGIAQFIRGVTL